MAEAGTTRRWGKSLRIRGAGTVFKLGGGQDLSAGHGSSWVEGYIPAEYPGAQLVLNKEVVNKLLGNGPANVLSS